DVDGNEQRGNRGVGKNQGEGAGALRATGQVPPGGKRRITPRAVHFGRAQPSCKRCATAWRLGSSVTLVAKRHSLAAIGHDPRLVQLGVLHALAPVDKIAVYDVN